MKERTKWFRKRALSTYQPSWKVSLSGMGTCCFYGNIPLDTIIRYATIEPLAPIQRASDPTITVTNYQILGWHYRNIVKRIFDDPNYEDCQPGFESYSQNLKNTKRTGIQVKEVNNHGNV